MLTTLRCPLKWTHTQDLSATLQTPKNKPASMQWTQFDHSVVPKVCTGGDSLSPWLFSSWTRSLGQRYLVSSLCCARLCHVDLFLSYSLLRESSRWCDFSCKHSFLAASGPKNVSHEWGLMQCSHNLVKGFFSLITSVQPKCELQTSQKPTGKGGFVQNLLKTTTTKNLPTM